MQSNHTPQANLFEYSTIRYVPDIEREEFINVGVIMMCKRRRWIKARFRVDPERLRGINAPHSAELLEHQLKLFTKVCEGKADGGRMAQAEPEERFRWLTAVKSCCLQTSRPHPGTTDDLDLTFDRIYSRMVE